VSVQRSAQRFARNGASPGQTTKLLDKTRRGRAKPRAGLFLRARRTIDQTSGLRLSSAGAVPDGHPTWTLGGWKRFLGLRDAVRKGVEYVEDNPAKGALSPQRWPFVKNDDGWPPSAIR